MKEEDASEAVTTALGHLDRAYDAAAEAIRAESDPRRAFERSTELVEAIRRLYEASGDLRAQSAARIFESEKMSLSVLANHIGVSKARAAQLINTAKAINKPDKPQKS
ncbi:hypothetical protein N5079_04915 [Planotetraspora sp. A-T 1434]|uniref:hypothetical protein n=1 Tax=Planotetraspora sp. A-T 1434 TaxID=2979219 RepID=UPI0021C0D510|nr:hypothetical protein [Planotetraspora sp. A-T 1434]MCT9929559.1 hypothetical protein [Planotetraspora sp. A-T 1434]